MKNYILIIHIIISWGVFLKIYSEITLNFFTHDLHKCFYYVKGREVITISYDFGKDVLKREKINACLTIDKYFLLHLLQKLILLTYINLLF